MIDVMGGCSTGVRKSIRELVGEKKKGDQILGTLRCEDGNDDANGKKQ